MSRFRVRTTDAQRAWKEVKVEEHGRELAKELGGRAYKFVSPNKRSVPDRLFILPTAPVHFFIEYKRWGGKPSSGQEFEIKRLLGWGVYVYVIDNIHEAEQVIRSAAAGTMLPMKEYSCPKAQHLYDEAKPSFLL